LISLKVNEYQQLTLLLEVLGGWRWIQQHLILRYQLPEHDQWPTPWLLEKWNNSWKTAVLVVQFVHELLLEVGELVIGLALGHQFFSEFGCKLANDIVMEGGDGVLGNRWEKRYLSGVLGLLFVGSIEAWAWPQQQSQSSAEQFRPDFVFVRRVEMAYSLSRQPDLMAHNATDHLSII
jgi:hypothetical protein